jgi:hypothetical protein
MNGHSFSLNLSKQLNASFAPTPNLSGMYVNYHSYRCKLFHPVRLAVEMLKIDYGLKSRTGTILLFRKILSLVLMLIIVVTLTRLPSSLRHHLIMLFLNFPQSLSFSSILSEIDYGLKSCTILVELQI